MSDQVKIPLPRSLQEIVGSLLFASQDPLTATELRDAVRAVEPEEGENAEVMDVYKTCTSREIDEAIKGLSKALEVAGCGFRLVCTGGTYRLQTEPSCGRYVRAMLKLDRPSRLGRASLETLAIIAYRQPIAKSEIEDIRGVDVSANIKTLMDLQLIRLVGRSELPGHPFLYGTTQIFLDHFGLANLQQLNELDPTLQRSNPRLKAEQYKRVEKKTELEKAAEEAAKEAGETPASPVTDDDAAPPVADDEMEDLTGKAGILPADTTAASEEDDFFIDDTPDEFDDEDEDDEDEDEDIDEEEEEDEDDK
ncbi:MAG: SMC-Scp complex subunit ScpB [Kiritimatiellae bacterium]|nr:SMC-Scp complex subunit ScpB [Kiritimatiellia bacterium]